MTDFLVELGTEELPPKSLNKLALSFAEGIKSGLGNAELTYEGCEVFASPRRLAVKIINLCEKQADTEIEKRGPALSHAYDKAGKPTKAALGFARGAGVDFESLTTIKTAKGEWIGITIKKSGQKATDLIGTIVKAALKKLPIPKLMRWGAHKEQFVRPVHTLLMLYGEELVDANILGLKADKLSLGHRFHHREALKISSVSDYEESLHKAFVIASFSKRRAEVILQIEALAKEVGGKLVKNDALIDEVTAIVEWPQALLASFDAAFLAVPKEALITSMATHQKSFALEDKNGVLLPYFITVANIESTDKARVVSGNEKVMCARLSDAAFFFQQDKQSTLESKAAKLHAVLFQEKLGTISDKVVRMTALAKAIANKLNLDEKAVARAAMLSKADLVTDMVLEFPSLQGVMGKYYALHDNESETVAEALYEQYLPRFSGDSLPKSPEGAVLSLVEKMDTLVGIFGIGQKPSGEKDPFKLRRNALGVIRLLLEKLKGLDIKSLIDMSLDTFEMTLPNKQTANDLHQFILTRLKVFLAGQGLSYDVLNAVLSVQDSVMSDVKLRAKALSEFVVSDKAVSLTQAFKRTNKLLAKSELNEHSLKVDLTLLDNDFEKALASSLGVKEQRVLPLVAQGNYQEALSELSNLKQPVDAFFDEVMVMVDDKALRENRLVLLASLRQLFLKVADLSQLQ